MWSVTPLLSWHAIWRKNTITKVFDHAFVNSEVQSLIRANKIWRMPAQRANRDFEIMQAPCMLETLSLYLHAIFQHKCSAQKFGPFFACGRWHDSKRHIMKKHMTKKKHLDILTTVRSCIQLQSSYWFFIGCQSVTKKKDRTFFEVQHWWFIIFFPFDWWGQIASCLSLPKILLALTQNKI